MGTLGKYGDVGAKRNKKRHKTLHGVRQRVNWGHAKTNEKVRKLVFRGTLVQREIMTDMG